MMFQTKYFCCKLSRPTTQRTMYVEVKVSPIDHALFLRRYEMSTPPSTNFLWSVLRVLSIYTTICSVISAHQQPPEDNNAFPVGYHCQERTLPFNSYLGPYAVVSAFLVPCFNWFNLQSIPKETHNLFHFFLWPPLGRGVKNSHGGLCKSEFYLHNWPCEILAPLPQRDHKKNKCAFLLE